MAGEEVIEKYIKGGAEKEGNNVTVQTREEDEEEKILNDTMKRNVIHYSSIPIEIMNE